MPPRTLELSCPTTRTSEELAMPDGSCWTQILTYLHGTDPNLDLIEMWAGRSLSHDTRGPNLDLAHLQKNQIMT